MFGDSFSGFELWQSMVAPKAPVMQLRSMNSSESRRMLSMYGPMASAQPRPVGTERVSERFDLNDEPAVAFLVAPVGVLAPKETVLLVFGEDVLAVCVGGIYLTNARAARDAVAVLRIKLREADIVAGVQDYGQNVALPHAHGDAKLVR